MRFYNTLRETLIYFIAILSVCLISSNTKAEMDFVGDQVCKDCHSSIYNEYIKSGHPHKIQATNGKKPVYPSGTSQGVHEPPKGHDWANISYVIGGFAWKARFMDSEGYILTGTANRQYNLENKQLNLDAHWTGYSEKSGERKPYTCGQCHTTGWQATGPDGPHQNDLVGIYGTWKQDGVTCEACHGPGSYHVKKPTQFKLNTEEKCNSCHIRGDIHEIDAKAGLIRHHEQYETLLASPHKVLNCSDCHNPHKSVKYPEKEPDYQALCLECHPKQTVKLNSNNHSSECISCHMPYLVKSAVSKTIETKAGKVPIGDIRTHIFRITTDINWTFFTDDGKFVNLDSEGKAHITLNQSCLTCHTNKTTEWAKDNSTKVH